MADPAEAATSDGAAANGQGEAAAPDWVASGPVEAAAPDGAAADGQVESVEPAPDAPAETHPAADTGRTNGGVRGPGESPWALPPQRPANGGAEAPRPSASGGPETVHPPVSGGPETVRPPTIDGPEAVRAGQPAHQPFPPTEAPAPPTEIAGQPVEGAGQQVEGAGQPAPAHPPGPYPPVLNPPGPLTPTAYPPVAGAPADPYAPGYVGAAPPVGWGPGPAQPGETGVAQPGTPGWHPPAWPQQGQPPAPQPPYQEADGVTRVPPGYPDQAWAPGTHVPPTAEDFARRRQARPAEPLATMGVRAVVNRMGLVRLAPGRHEQELRRDIEMVRRNFGGLRQVTVVNPKGGAGKTVAILLLAMTFGQKRGGYVLAWDNNETQGTLGMRAQQDFHSRTVRDLLRDLGQFQGAHGRVGDLSQYVRSQGEGMFDVLASDESATGGEMLTASAFAEIREVVSRFYKLIFVDTGNNVRAQNWQAAMDATDQLVVTMSARNDSAETAARMLDHLEQSGRQRLVRQAVTVVSMPPSRKEIDLPAIQDHFAARTRAVLLAPYERLIDTGEPLRYGQLSSATRDAWLKIAAAVAEGL
ncbi:chromosome partitioning protein [Micromonospora sp. NPDC048830]|uniref:chromosome partitioning protein n=1 Tax=Micromonospora sp. NPDC048830 TaxID=3364257 RepID=UPI0037157D2C